MTAKAGDMLRKAAEIVDGARNATHGDKERSFQAIARMWNAYLDSRKNPEALLDGADVCRMMVLMKMGRSMQGDGAEPDHYIDMAGYAAISGECAGAGRPKMSNPTDSLAAFVIGGTDSPSSRI